MPSPRPVRPSPSVVVPETLTGAPPRAADRAASASARPGRDPRAVADHLNGHVSDDEAGLGQNPAGLAQKGGAARARPLGPVGAELPTQIAEAGRRQQRVAGGMGGHVSVGVAGQAGLARPQQAGQVERAVGR